MDIKFDRVIVSDFTSPVNDYEGIELMVEVEGKIYRSRQTFSKRFAASVGFDARFYALEQCIHEIVELLVHKPEIGNEPHALKAYLEAYYG